MPVLMLMLITLLNDGTLISVGYDRYVAPHLPTISDQRRAPSPPRIWSFCSGKLGNGMIFTRCGFCTGSGEIFAKTVRVTHICHR